MPATHAQETCARNLRRLSPSPETCTKNLTQVYCSFLLQDNSAANHVARFESCAGQFLCWNEAVLNCVQETCRRKTLPDRPTHVQVSCTRRLAQVSLTSFLDVCRRHNTQQHDSNLDPLNACTRDDCCLAFKLTAKSTKYKKAQLSLTKPRDAKACRNCFNSACLQRCR